MGSAVDNVDIISSLLSENLLLNPQDLRRKGHMIIDFLADYYENIENYPVRSQVEPGYLSKRVPESAPFNPEPIETILEDIQNDIIPGLSHWQSPNHFAYFPCAVSTAGILGELLSAGFNVVGLSWVTSPAATELESIVMNWLGKLLQLPKSFLFSSSSLSSSSSVIDDKSNNIDDNKVGGGGVMLGTTCEAILCTIVAARDQMLNKIGTGNIDKLVVYGSDQTHCGFQKSAKIAGINPRNIRAITTSKATDYSLCPTAFMSTVLSDIESGLIPLYLCTTVGTTPTTAIDPIGPLCKVAKEYNIWVHIDAAYAGSACICPEFRHLIDGVEEANSFSLNAHKWLFTSLDCCCLWVKDSSALIRALSTNPEYLKNKATDSKKVIDYKDWQIALSRRFRSMKLWLVLRSYGVTNLRKFLRNCIEMAKQFEKLIVMDKRFEILVPRTLSMVCFRLKQIKILDDQKMNKRIDSVEDEGMILNQMNRKLLESINASGRVYMTHAMIEDVYIIRFAVGGTLTEEQHVHSAWKVIQEHTDAMLGALNSK